MAKDLPPDASTLREQEYAVVTFPGKYGHSEKSPLLAQGAYYLGNAFRKLLGRVNVPFHSETVKCAPRSGKIVERTRALLSKWSTTPAKDTDAIRHFDQLKADTKADYNVCLRHFMAGRKILHPAASHDAIGRVTALKTVYPEALIFDFDAHPDLQVPGSGDNPGDASAINGHAAWVSAVLRTGSPVLDKLIPEGARTLEREDIFQAGVRHPDRSEVIEAAGTVDPVTKKVIKAPIPGMTRREMDEVKDDKAAETELKKRLRTWIDERKKRYNVDVVHMGIEDDPDSTDKADVGDGVHMSTFGGLSANFKVLILEWLAEQPDVEIMYYGTSEVIPQYDEGEKAKKQIERWASAALGFGDTQYYHKGYEGGAEPDARERRYARPSLARRAVPYLTTAIAASILTLIGGKALSPDNQKPGPTTPKYVKTKFNDNPFAMERTSNFLGMFSKHSGFREQAEAFQEAVIAGDEAAKERALTEMVRIYQTANNEARDENTKSYLGIVAHSEFVRGAGLSADYGLLHDKMYKAS